MLDTLRTQFNPVRDHHCNGRCRLEYRRGGNCGIACAKEFYRPTVILGGSPDGLRGSGRSIKGFDLAAALKECDADRYGATLWRLESVCSLAIWTPFERLNEVAKSKLTKEMLTDLETRRNHSVARTQLGAAIS